MAIGISSLFRGAESRGFCVLDCRVSSSIFADTLGQAQSTSADFGNLPLKLATLWARRRPLTMGTWWPQRGWDEGSSPFESAELGNMRNSRLTYCNFMPESVVPGFCLSGPFCTLGHSILFIHLAKGSPCIFHMQLCFHLPFHPSTPTPIIYQLFHPSLRVLICLSTPLPLPPS